MDEVLARPCLLTREHDVGLFDCGKQRLNDYLVRFALQNQAGGGARTYVLARGVRVVGYYSLAPATIAVEDAPARVAKGQGRYPVPAILMARFALDLREQGKGLGKALLRDALLRAVAGAEIIGGRVFLVHAKDEEDRSFYVRYGMEESPTNPFHLMLLFKDIRHTVDMGDQSQGG